MGIARTFTIAMIGITAAILSLASCEKTGELTPAGRELMQRATRGSSVVLIPTPAVAPATAPAAGLPRTQWVTRIDVTPMRPDYAQWRDSTAAVHQRFTATVQEQLQHIADRNPHCTITAFTVINAAVGWIGSFEGGPYVLPSGALAVFHCPNGEPLIT